jgi:RNase adaptor protein for sRNA GlmZ degradation
MVTILTPQSDAEVGIYTFGKDSPNRVATCQYVIDVSGLRDPGSSGGFRKTFQDGRPGAVQDFVAEDPRVKAVIDSIRMFAFMHLRSEAADHKWLSFGLKDHHGRWTAPAIGEIAATKLAEAHYKVSLFHADLEKTLV